MLLNELPEDILVQVVKCAAYTYIHMAGDWQASLVLLSVCRQWRQLARPLIYGGMYIHYQDGDISSRATDETDMVEAVADPPLLLTNADLIAATGSASYVKYVDAYVYCHESPFDGLDMILDTLCGIQPCWPSVNKLAVDLEYSLRTPITNSTSPSPMKKEIGHIGDRLSQMMPNMQRLIMEGCGDSQIDSTLYETLANKYTGQLKVLECTNPIQSIGHQEFSNLTVLTLCFDSLDGRLVPCICPEPLECLRLMKIASDSIWLAFQGSKPSGKVDFANLKRLELTYKPVEFGDAGEIEAARVEMRFPKLQCLRVDNIYKHCAPLSCGVFPRHLDELKVDCSASVCRLLGSASRFERIADARLSVVADAADVPGISPAVDRLYAAVHGRWEAKLIVVQGEITSKLNWPRLTALRVLAPVDLATAYKAVNTIPTLSKLVLHELVMDKFMDEQPRTRQEQYAAPFASNVKEIVLSYGPSTCSDGLLFATTMEFALRAPLLRELTTGIMPPDRVAAFVKQHRAQYPHLDTIRFQTNDMY